MKTTPATMTVKQARAKRDWPSIKVGQLYEFHCELQQEYEPPAERLRNYTGQRVTVLEEYPPGSPENEDPDSSVLFKVRAGDGKEFTAWWEELSGWDKALGQFFPPESDV